MKASKDLLRQSTPSTDTQQPQSSREESKGPEEDKPNVQLQKLKFEKYILLLLLGCCDLSEC
jgi:hypothetical protein